MKQLKALIGRRIMCTVRAGGQEKTFTDTLEAVERGWEFDDEFEPTPSDQMVTLVFTDHIVSVPNVAWSSDGVVMVLQVGDAVITLEAEGYVAQSLW